MSIRKELSLLGLAAKAGKVVSGEFATENAVKSGESFSGFDSRRRFQ